MRHKIIPLLAEYFYEDWSKVAVVLGDGDGMNGSHFLESGPLPALPGLADDEPNGEKRRWSVKARFDFSEFRSEEHTSELQSLMRISYAVFCLKKKKETLSYR